MPVSDFLSQIEVPVRELVDFAEANLMAVQAIDGDNNEQRGIYALARAILDRARQVEAAWSEAQSAAMSPR